MRKFVFFVVILLLASVFAQGQTRKFQWEDEICVFEGTYNAKRYTKKQLEDTYHLWYSRDFQMDTYDATAFKIEDIEKLRSVESLEAEYAKKSAALKALQVVNVPFWKDYKQKKLKELEMDYQLARASAQAFKNPAVLREITFADACVARFAPPLTTGGDELLRIWREVNVDLRAKNADPERVRREFEAQLVSADKFQYAQVEVITFGWWNCVNERIERADYSVGNKNFWKLFSRVKKIACDDA